MKKYLFLTMLLVGLMACSTAPPPTERFNSVEENETVSATQIPLSNAFVYAALTKDSLVSSGNSFANRLIIETKKENQTFVAQVWEVSDKYGDLIISVDKLSDRNLYASLSAGYQDISEPTTETINNEIGFMQKHWLSLLLGFLAFAKVVVNLTPSEKDNKIFTWLDTLINGIIPNLKKGGGTHDEPG